MTLPNAACHVVIAPQFVPAVFAIASMMKQKPTASILRTFDNGIPASPRDTAIYMAWSFVVRPASATGNGRRINLPAGYNSMDVAAVSAADAASPGARWVSM